MDTPQSIFYVVSILVAVTTPIGAYIHIRTILAALGVKVEAMWDLHTRRALQLALDTGMATRNSPLVITLEAQEYCSALRDDLTSWYAKLPKPIDDSHLMLALSKEFGSRILGDISLPGKIDHGVCLLIATAVAKGNSKIVLRGEEHDGCESLT